MIIFVYGTLKKGFKAHDLLATSTFLGTVYTKPLYRLFSKYYYPCMISCAIDGKKIQGEIYSIDYSTLKRLNEYEGTASGLYSLEVIEIDTSSLQNNYKCIDQDYCLGYLYLGDISQLIEINSWNRIEPYVNRENRI